MQITTGRIHTPLIMQFTTDDHDLTITNDSIEQTSNPAFDLSLSLSPQADAGAIKIKLGLRDGPTCCL